MEGRELNIEEEQMNGEEQKRISGTGKPKYCEENGQKKEKLL